MPGISDQYKREIESFSAKLAAAKEQLKSLKELKRASRHHSVGRLANDDWSTRLSVAKYDMQISACEATIALLTNQIKLRKEAIAKERAEAKAKKTEAKSPSKKKTSQPASKIAVKKTVKKTSTSSKVKKTADGSVDKRTKEGKAIAERMAKARKTVQKKQTTKKPIKKK